MHQQKIMNIFLFLFYNNFYLILISGLGAVFIREWRIAKRQGVVSQRRVERIHLHTSPPHPTVPTLVPSHQRAPQHSQRRITTVDTIVITR
jgi:hypothetical protein